MAGRSVRLLANKFSTDVLWNIASFLVLALSGFAINILISAASGEAALGVFNQVYALYVISSQFAVGGLQHSVLMHVSQHQHDKVECVKIVTSALCLVFASSVIVVLCGVRLRGVAGHALESEDVASGILYAAPGLVFFSVNKAVLMLLNGMRHMRTFAALQSARYLIIMVAVSLLVMARTPAAKLPLALTGAEVVLSLILGIYLWLFVAQTRCPPGFSLRWCRRHAEFGIKGFMSGVLGTMNTRLDVLLLGLFRSDGIVGVYSFAATFAEGLSLLSHAVRLNVDPILARDFSAGTRENIPNTVRAVRKIFWPCMTLLGAAVVASYPLLVSFLRERDLFMAAWPALLILVVGVVINAGYRPFLGLLLMGGAPGLHTMMLLLLICSNAAIGLLVIPHYGMVGAACSAALVLSIEGLVLMTFARKSLAVQV